MIRWPDLVLDGHQVLEKALKDCTTKAVHLAVCECFREYLQLTDKGALENAKDTGKQGEHDAIETAQYEQITNASYNLVSAQIKSVTGLVLAKDSDIRYESLSILKMIWTQGLTNPLLIIPYLVAALTERETKNREIASATLQNIATRRPDLLAMRFGEGVVIS